MLCCYAISQAITLMALPCFPHNCFSFYISPVNKPHLLCPTTHALATNSNTHKLKQTRTLPYTQARTTCQSGKLTFTLHCFTKGHEGPSLKSIHFIWMASVYTGSRRGCVATQNAPRCSLVPSLALLHSGLNRSSYGRLKGCAHTGGLSLYYNSVLPYVIFIQLWNGFSDCSHFLGNIYLSLITSSFLSTRVLTSI